MSQGVYYWCSVNYDDIFGFDVSGVWADKCSVIFECVDKLVYGTYCLSLTSRNAIIWFLLCLFLQTDSVVGNFYGCNYIALLFSSKSFILLLHSNLFSTNSMLSSVLLFSIHLWNKIYKLDLSISFLSLTVCLGFLWLHFSEPVPSSTSQKYLICFNITPEWFRNDVADLIVTTSGAILKL